MLKKVSEEIDCHVMPSASTYVLCVHPGQVTQPALLNLRVKLRVVMKHGVRKHVLI
jgi:hypothetical protein